MNTFLDPAVPYIKLFGFEHALNISIIVYLFVMIMVNRKNLKNHSTLIRVFLFSLTLFQQMLLYGWYAAMTGFDLTQALPLHLCRISTLLSLIYFITLNQKIMDIVFYFGLFAYGSFALPIAIHPLTHALGISYLTNHSLTLLLPFIAYYTWDWKPQKENLKLVTFLYIVYIGVAMAANIYLDGNYFYLVDRPFLKTSPEWIYLSITLFIPLILFRLIFSLINHFMYKNV